MNLAPPGTRLDATVRIPVLAPLRAVNRALLELLRDLGAEDWARPTVHADREVKDLTAHLLHGNLRRVSSLRDQYRPPLPAVDELVDFIQRDNRAFMAGMRRVSPPLLIELIERYDAQVLSLFESLDPDAPGLGVAWAGEAVSSNWFDVAREYTEKWHHQQQLRDATRRPPLHDALLFTPVLETFARGLPFAYRSAGADGDQVSIATAAGGPAGLDLGWTLRRADGAWSLFSGADPAAPTRITIPADVAWRLWTKGIDGGEARASIQVAGDARAVEPLVQFVAIMA